MVVNDFTGIEIVVAFRRTSMEHRFRKDRVHLDLRPLKKDYFALPISPPPPFFFFSFLFTISLRSAMIRTIQ